MKKKKITKKKVQETKPLKSGTEIKTEDVKVEPILKEPVKEEPTLPTQIIPTSPTPEKPDKTKQEEDLDKAYYDFAESIHSTLYEKLMNIQIEKNSLDKLNRSGAKVWKKLDKWDFIEKYADFVVYGITTLEILSGALVDRAKRSKQQSQPDQTIKTAEVVSDNAPLSDLKK